MKVQLLFFPGCSNAEAARAALRHSLEASRLRVAIEEVDVTAADAPHHLRDWGSPTILIDGVDVGGERAPTGASCRLYTVGGDPKSRGVPADALIRSALERARGPGWIRGQSLAALPAALVALLPAAACPACLPAYAGVLSAVGLGFLFNDRILGLLIAVFLAVGIASVGWSTRSHRQPGPLVATLAGSAAIVAGRFIWNIPPVLYGGAALLIGASIWNIWLKRSAGSVACPKCAVQPSPERK
jgi:hypothetical protein